MDEEEQKVVTEGDHEARRVKLASAEPKTTRPQRSFELGPVSALRCSNYTLVSNWIPIPKQWYILISVYLNYCQFICLFLFVQVRTALEVGAHCMQVD